MKKIFSLVLALALMLGACISASALEVNTEISGEITYLTWGEPSRGTSMERIADVFMGYYPNIKVTIDCAGDNFGTKFMTLAAAGTPADVVLVNELYGTGYYCNDMYENLTPMLEKDAGYKAEVMDKIPDDVKNVFYWQGECFALPTMNYVFSLYYNKDMFDEAGIAYPDSGWTWQSVRDAANVLTKKEDGVTSQYGIYFTREIVYEFSWFYNNGSYIISDDRKTCDLDSPAAIETWQWMQDLIHKDGCAPVPDTTAGGSQLSAMSFDTGKVAMQLFGSWMLPTYETLPFNWGAAPIPSKDGSKPGFSSSCPNGFGIGKGTKYPEAAWEFVKFCTSEEGQTLIAEEGLAQPTLESVMYTDAFSKGSTVADMNIIRQSLLTCKGPNAVPRWNEILQNYISIAVDNILINNADVESEAKACAEGVNGLLDQIQQGIYN